MFNPMATVLITGGTGLVGTQLTEELLKRGYEVIVLSRKAKQSSIPSLSYAVWDVEKGSIDEQAIKKADHIVHLAGAGVADKRWSAERKQEIVDSRTRSAALIVKALKEIHNQVKTVVSASAIGWYGPDTAESRKNGFKEDATADKHFLGETCRLWEESISPVQNLGKRLVKLRIGIVLSEKGGALKEFMKPIRFGTAAILSKGTQVISWIHVEDLCRMFIHAIEHEKINGVYNAVAPHPVTNKELTLQLAQKLRGKFYIPVHVPAFALKIGLGEMSIEVLKSATVSAGKIQKAGFSFLYPTITAALHLK
jgi:uncharacterized protein (TIGR01777 family)